jgi:Domain of unknown function (DUF5130)
MARTWSLEVAQVENGDVTTSPTVETPTVVSRTIETDETAAPSTAVAYRSEAGLPHGSAVTTSGRISGVTEPGEFPVKDLVILDDALKFGSRGAKARFAVYLGDLGSDPAAKAREILASVPTPDNAVLLAVSPNQRAIEVVYGADVQGRGIEEAAPLGVSAAAASFAEGNLMDGLISAVRVLSAAVSPP